MDRILIADIDAALSLTHGRASAPALPPLTADIDIDELCDIASETDERGPLETIVGLLRALGIRHADVDATNATLAAIERHHLPALLDLQVTA